MSHGGVPHHAENQEHKRIGIFISIIAVAMAVIASLAKNEANKMIVKEVQSSNGFAWYQAKRQRTYMNDLELNRIDFQLAGAVTEAQRKVLEQTKAKLVAKNAEYNKENEQIKLDADKDKRSAEVASHQHHRFEYAEVAMHIAIVLCSLTLLTDTKLFFHLGLAATIGGLALAAIAFFEGREPVSAPAGAGTPVQPSPAKH